MEAVQPLLDHTWLAVVVTLILAAAVVLLALVAVWRLPGLTELHVRLGPFYVHIVNSHTPKRRG